MKLSKNVQYYGKDEPLSEQINLKAGPLNLFYEADVDWLQCTAKYTKSSLENKYDQPRDRYSIYLKCPLYMINFSLKKMKPICSIY